MSFSPYPFPPFFRLGNAPNIHIKTVSLGVLLDIDVDREMSVDVAHFVLESPRHADDHVVDECLDSTECSDIFPRAVMEFDDDGVFAPSCETDG